MDIINLHNISKQYGHKIIFQGLNLKIPTGSFTLLRGKSGAGKTTLLNLISGLETPTNGQIIINDKDINTLTTQERVNFYRHEIGIVFQGSYLQPHFTLAENIILPGVFSGMAKLERTTKANQLAHSLGIFDVLNNLPQEVSGGQAERACIARALLLNPKIILADEPTNNLDDVNAIAVLKILDHIRQHRNITIIVAGHDQNILKFATQIATIEDGKITNDLQGTI